MIDPLERWRKYGEKPDYAGPLTYGGAPCTQDAFLLAGFDVAIVGAPMDDLALTGPAPVTDRASADVTALVADRIVREILTGIALKRRG